jgi:glucose/arabinose dehydrogenase
MPGACSEGMNAIARWAGAAAACALALGLGGCFALRPSSGGGQTEFSGPRKVDAADVAVPPGYRIERVAEGLDFPTGVAFDERGRPHVVESGYAYGEIWTTPRLLRIEADGRAVVVAQGGSNGPWNGVAFHAGAFFVAEGGTREGGRILRIGPDGRQRVLAEGLPSLGDHHTNGPAIGPDGFVYFGQGTATNAGVVGEDNAEFGWLERHPEFHDVPCGAVTLTGENFRAGGRETGAFSAFGAPTARGQVVAGALPCSGAVLRVRRDGGALELVAWGFRNPFGLAFAPDGTLFVSDNAYDARGSRPVHGAGDLLWRVEAGRWYGWPDYHGARRLDDGDHYDPPGAPRPRPLLAAPPGAPPEPVAVLGVHSSANGFDFARSEGFGHAGDAFVALFGDMAPGVGKTLAPVGFSVVRVEVASGVVHDFAVNRGAGPASRLGGGGLERPVAVRFSPSGDALYVVDFGVMTTGERPSPRLGTGVLWRITRASAAR